MVFREVLVASECVVLEMDYELFQHGSEQRLQIYFYSFAPWVLIVQFEQRGQEVLGQEYEQRQLQLKGC
jgi:hypothetical protein